MTPNDNGYYQQQSPAEDDKLSVITSDKDCRTQLLRWDNIALPWCYLTVGLCQGKSGQDDEPKILIIAASSSTAAFCRLLSNN